MVPKPPVIVPLVLQAGRTPLELAPQGGPPSPSLQLTPQTVQEWGVEEGLHERKDGIPPQ